MLCPTGDGVFALVSARLGRDGHAQLAVGIAGVRLFDLQSLNSCEALHRKLGQVGMIAQRWIEGKTTFILLGNFTGRLAMLIEARALEVPEVSDVVRRLIPVDTTQRRLAWSRLLAPRRCRLRARVQSFR